MDSQTIAMYARSLEQVEAFFQRRHFENWVTVIGSWRDELVHTQDLTGLKAHAQRTARALGGMGSIGDIALAEGDKELLSIVDELHRTCKTILAAESGSENGS